MRIKIQQRLYFLLFIIAGISYGSHLTAQPFNRVYLLGYLNVVDTPNATTSKLRMVFDSTSYQLLPETRKMPFRAAQATISDSLGNLLIASNGCWIADATGDTMQNGGGLNPNSFTSSWCGATSANPYSQSNLLLPDPGNANQYYLFHETGDYNCPSTCPTTLYYSLINLTYNNGLGEVLQKNISILQQNLNLGITACKHANGRDWWIVCLKENTNQINVFLLTPAGIQYMGLQTLGFGNNIINTITPQFSFDGTKFCNLFYTGTWNNFTIEVRLCNFDRCTGTFSNFTTISNQDSLQGFGLQFSPNSKYLYWSTWNKIFQLNTDTSDIAASQQLVAVNDGYYSPFSPFHTDFWLMYLAANGKIYISSGNGVVDMHYIDYPDSAGVACGVQQHALHLSCWNVRTHVNHPNYALGPVVGSVCDSLSVGIEELQQVRNVKLYPNPVKSGGPLTLYYELPQNKAGVFEISDALGRKVYCYALPPWSNTQSLQIPSLTPGLYLCSIRSGGSQMTVKVVVN